MRKIAATMPVPVDWLSVPPMPDLMGHELAEMEAEMDDYFHNQPRFHPTRSDYNAVMQPVWRRERIRARAQELMPGKRPGRFVR